MFSKEWQDKINDWESTRQFRDFPDVYKNYYRFNSPRHKNPVILTEGVWVLWYDPLSCKYVPRKIRAITANDAIYDGVYNRIYSTVGIGGLSYKFKIDHTEIELYSEDEKTNQQKLLAFIKEQTGISDVELPKVPKGILKI